LKILELDDLEYYFNDEYIFTGGKQAKEDNEEINNETKNNANVYQLHL
jgi:hypothetical protein